MLRLKDEFWDHAARARASLANGTMLDLPDHGQGFLSAAPQRFLLNSIIEGADVEIGRMLEKIGLARLDRSKREIVKLDLGKVIDAVRQLRNRRNDGTSCHQHQDARAPGRDTSEAQPVSRAGRPLVSGPQEHIRECGPGGIDRHERHRRVLPGHLVQLHDGHRRSSPAMPVASGPRPRRLPVGARRQKHLRCHPLDHAGPTDRRSSTPF